MMNPRLYFIPICCFVSLMASSQTEPAVDLNDSLPSMVVLQIQSIREMMDDVPNPVRLKYQGSELHDYFYFPFETESGHSLDFGDGYSLHNLGGIPFTDMDAPFFDFVGDDWTEVSPGNTEMLNQWFWIEWTWGTGSIVCCEGGMTSYPAQVPVIVNIEKTD